MCGYTVADEAREEEMTGQQPEVSADENAPTEKQEQANDEPDIQIQTTKHSKLESLINTSINEKLEQLQVDTWRHNTAVGCGGRYYADL